MFIGMIKHTFWESSEFRQYFVVVIVNLNVFCMGLGWAWSSPVLVKLGNSTQMVLSRSITELEGSWIAAIYWIGLITGFPVTYLVDRIGRKYCMIFAASTKIFSSLFSVFANEVWMLMFSRGLSGFSDNFHFVTIPMYTAEIAHNQIRGSLGTILQIFGTLGVVAMLCVGPFLDYLTLNITILCLVAAAAIPLLFIPDSPYFLYKTGRNEEARKVLKFFRSSELHDDEIDAYKSETNNNNCNVMTILKSKTIRKSILYTIIIGSGSQLTGYNGVQYYLQTILESTETSVPSEIASAILGAMKLLPCVLTVFLVDRCGRKPILIITLMGQITGLVGLGAYFHILQLNHKIMGALNALPLISLTLVVCCYSAGLGSVIWILWAELFDGSSRAFGIGVGMIVLSFCGFLTILFFTPITNALGPALTYWLFAFNCLLLCIFIIFFIPETKGKSIEAIQIDLGKRS